MVKTATQFGDAVCSGTPPIIIDGFFFKKNLVSLRRIELVVHHHLGCRCTGSMYALLFTLDLVYVFIELQLQEGLA